jgi:hypothetical protein
MSIEEVQKSSIEYYALMDKILNHFAGDLFQDEVRLAKIEFFENSGVLDENAENYEIRMSQFFDWYLFTRDLKGYSQPPLDSVHMARELRFSDEEVTLLENLKKTRHGLFEFLKIKGSEIFLKDLLKNEKIVIKNSPWTFGFDENEIFEARLIPYKDSFIFTKGFCFHPKEAKKYILSEIKRHQKDPDLNPDDMMLKLIKMRYRFERYRHVKADLIYSSESSI